MLLPKIKNMLSLISSIFEIDMDYVGVINSLFL